MSAETLQTLQTAAIILASLSGLFGGVHHPPTTCVIKLSLTHRSILRPLCAGNLVDLSAGLDIVEEAAMGHHCSVCTAGVAFSHVSRACTVSWISSLISSHAPLSSRVPAFKMIRLKNYSNGQFH